MQRLPFEVSSGKRFIEYKLFSLLLPSETIPTIYFIPQNW